MSLTNSDRCKRSHFLSLAAAIGVIQLVTFFCANAWAIPFETFSLSANFSGTYYGPDGSPAYYGAPATASVSGQFALSDPQPTAQGGETVVITSSNFTISGPLPPTTMPGLAPGGETLNFSAACVTLGFVPCLNGQFGLLASSVQTGTFPQIISGNFAVDAITNPPPGTSVFSLESGSINLNTQGTANPCCSFSGTLTNGSITASAASCAAILNNLSSEMTVGAVAPLSQTGEPTSMLALFHPAFGMSLQDAATLCGYKGWDFQQTVTALPPEVASPFSPAGGGPPPTAPFLDPVPGGYAYQLPNPCVAYPFYYDPTSDAATCALSDNSVTPDPFDLVFNDNPQAACNLSTFDALGSSCFFEGDAYGFDTDLVGILPNGQPGPDLYQWSWLDNYSTTLDLSTGGISRLDSGVPVTPGGTGGITLLSQGTVGTPTPSVPEPNTLALLALPSLMALRLSWTANVRWRKI